MKNTPIPDINVPRFIEFIVLWFNDTSTLVGHFVLSLREREKEIEQIVEDTNERDRDERGTGVKVKKKKK